MEGQAVADRRQRRRCPHHRQRKQRRGAHATGGIGLLRGQGSRPQPGAGLPGRQRRAGAPPGAGDDRLARGGRGAAGAEPNTGDGAGILLQVPDRFFRDVVDFPLPQEGHYATGIAFLPNDPEKADEAALAIEKIAGSEGLRVLGWRDVPYDDSMIGSMAKGVEPLFRQPFLAGDGLAKGGLGFG